MDSRHTPGDTQDPDGRTPEPAADAPPASRDPAADPGHAPDRPRDRSVDPPGPPDHPAEQPSDDAAEPAPGLGKALAVGVVFDPGQPVVYFRRDDLQLVPGDSVVARLERAVDLGRVTGLVYLPADQVAAMPSLLRRASAADLRRREDQNARREQALACCAERIAEHNLSMRLIDCYYTLDGRRLVFYFAADGRVDFRALVRDLARIFRCRIELRQVGVRDHAKLVGGIGPCGRPLCCAQFLRTFDPVGIRVAKEQGLALNPAKLSGLCDRLMCCLLYEHDTYRALADEMPAVGTPIETPRGPGRVQSANPLTQQITVALDEGSTVTFSLAQLMGTAPEPEAARPESDRRPREADETAPAARPRRSGRGRHGRREPRTARAPDPEGKDSSKQPGDQTPGAGSQPQEPQESRDRQDHHRAGSQQKQDATGASRGRRARPRWRRKPSSDKRGE